MNRDQTLDAARKFIMARVPAGFDVSYGMPCNGGFDDCIEVGYEQAKARVTLWLGAYDEADMALQIGQIIDILPSENSRFLSERNAVESTVARFYQ